MANGGIIGPVQTVTAAVAEKLSTFSGSGSLTAQGTGAASFLVIGGGGSGGEAGDAQAGGGGAGGYRSSFN